jgi:ADP-heptose:LPS heptosyltransferase
MNSSKVKDVKKIAVLRAGALGDFIVTLPALKAIRAAYPDGEIVILGKPWHKKFLLKNRTPADRVIVVPVIKGVRDELHEVEDAGSTEAFFEQVKQEQFDIAINFQGNGIPANPFIKRLNAKLTVGLTSEYAEKLDRSLNFYYYQSEVIRYLEVVKLIGAYTSDIEPQINILQQDEEEIEGFIRSLNNKPFIVLQPCAVDIRRMWPLENYPLLADKLKQTNIEVVFTGSEEDKNAVDDIITSMKESAINICGFSVGGLTALLSKAALVIGADTGPLHLASAVNTPTIGIYWAPNLINWGPVTRGIHRPVVSWNMACPLCGIIPNDPYPFEPRTNCNHAISFVRDITVQQVLDAAVKLCPQLLQERTENKFQFTEEGLKIETQENSEQDAQVSDTDMYRHRHNGS